MRISTDTKLDFNDILIKPAVLTNISSRSQINPFDKNGMLPIFTAPMDTVVDSTNCDLFNELKINITLPRGEKRTQNNMFESYSLKQFVDTFLTVNDESQTKWDNSELPLYVLIDTANGHTQDLINAVKSAKELYKNDMVLMVGNIANPETYSLLSNAGADYIRCGIGNGNGCLTTQQLGVGFPMASLISECYVESLKLDNPAKIVADGGMKDYSDIIKALALGADYVMIGSLFNKCVESCGDSYITTSGKPIKITNKEAINHFYNSDLGEGKILKLFRGMSTKDVQKKWGKEKLTTSEGVVRYREVEYGLGGWVDNFESYLRSAMSYTNSIDLNQFINSSEFIRISDNAYHRFKK